MPHIVLKLDGGALSDGGAFEHVAKTVRGNPLYTQIVPAAPTALEWHMTDVLRKLERTEERDRIYWELTEWLLGVARTLALGPEFEDWVRREVTALAEHVVSGTPNWAFVTSRGEYWAATILGRKLRIPVVDPVHLIKFTASGEPDERAIRRAFAAMELPEQFVMPGFYGSDADGNIRTFPKSGSDISAAILAAETRATELHIARRNVAGIPLMNPGIRIGSPLMVKVIEQMTYEQAQCLSSRADCGILHRHALAPIIRADIPVRVFDLLDQAKPGTRIGSGRHLKRMNAGQIIGIAERPGLTVFTLKRARTRKRRTIMQGILSVLQQHHLDFEHEVVSRDAVSFSVRNDALRGRQEKVAKSLKVTLRALVSYQSSEGVICLVGNKLGSDLIHLGGLIVALGTHCGNGAGRPADEVRLSFLAHTACGTCVMFGIENDTLRIAVNRLYDEIMRRKR